MTPFYVNTFCIEDAIGIHFQNLEIVSSYVIWRWMFQILIKNNIILSNFVRMPSWRQSIIYQWHQLFVTFERISNKYSNKSWSLAYSDAFCMMSTCILLFHYIFLRKNEVEGKYVKNRFQQSKLHLLEVPWHKCLFESPFYL